ncbi:hypothetical protein DZK27_07940 [Rhodobacteraceae bacterium 63075]|nr:hypothetical protein DZK27_07940 [Rhodobacteraceae bacterium 63075]
MKHLTATALALMTLPLAASAETAEEREARCAAQGDIMAKAAEMRLERRSEKRAKAELAETVDEQMKTSVPLLVGYVYTLSRKDLKGVDVRANFVEQCTGAVID